MDEREEFANWVDLWDKEMKDRENRPAPAPKAKRTLGGDNIFGFGSSGGFDAQEDSMPSTSHDDYWNYLAGGETELLNEEETPNPVYPDSVGKDQENPKPQWVSEELLKDVEEMKRKLYDVEVKLGKEDGGGEKWVEKCHEPDDKKLLGQIEDLRKKIDELSNKLGMEEEPKNSLWNTGKKQ